MSSRMPSWRCGGVGMSELSRSVGPLTEAEIEGLERLGVEFAP